MSPLAGVINGAESGGDVVGTLQGKGSKHPWLSFLYSPFRSLLWICSSHVMRTLDSNPRDVDGIKHVHIINMNGGDVLICERKKANAGMNEILHR